MIQKVLITMIAIVFLNTITVFSQVVNNIELFDIQKGKVIKTVPSSPLIQSEAQQYISGIEKIYSKLSPIPKTGFMIKIPLEQTIHVENQWMNAFVDEIIIIFTKGEKPYLLTFNDENNALVFTFNGGNTNELLKIFDIKPEDIQLN